MQPESLLHPTHILLSGATTKHGIALRHNLASAPFTGTLTETLADHIDIALIADLAGDVPAALARLTGKLRGPAIIYADIETDSLRAAARAAHVRVIGGRSFGIANPAIGLNALLAPRAAPPGPVAELSQSAAIARAGAASTRRNTRAPSPAGSAMRARDCSTRSRDVVVPAASAAAP
jgi:acetyltransferase